MIVLRALPSHPITLCVREQERIAQKLRSQHHTPKSTQVKLMLTKSSHYLDMSLSPGYGGSVAASPSPGMDINAFRVC